ncbi:hypothetical protein PRIPAC_70842, partial [Pristionchus pacificus]|uniref:Uncharacterized protein n=1 Tax=Pristionchus pacificus TaxID=54126 RepID=A0A2A6C098_PRIPA
ISIDILQNICHVIFPTPTLLIVCFCNTFVNLGVMFFIKRVNKGRNSLEKHLSYRYQVKENVLISSAILPLTYISFIFTFSIFPFLYLMKKESHPESRQLYTAVFFLGNQFIIEISFNRFLSTHVRHRPLTKCRVSTSDDIAWTNERK